MGCCFERLSRNGFSSQITCLKLLIEVRIMKNEEVYKEISGEISRAELEKKQLETELQKMQLEIDDLRFKCGKLQRGLAFSPLLGAFLTFISVSIGIFALWMSYTEQKEQANLTYNEQNRQAKLTYGKPLFDKHLNFFEEAVKTV